MTKNFITKIHLIISVIVVAIAAIVYGFAPNFVLDLMPETIDEHNFNKGIMGLYMGFASLWLLGLFKTSFFKAALVSNLVFMLGLGFGKIVSLLTDGIPSSLYIYGTLGELFLGFYGVWVLLNHHRTTNT